MAWCCSGSYLGRTDFNGGSGDNDFTDFKYYSTNIRQHDHYMDFVARIGRLDSDYDTNYGDHADYKNWAGSLSIEYGRKKKIDKRNWYIEPQSQMTYSYIWGRDYTTKMVFLFIRTILTASLVVLALY